MDIAEKTAQLITPLNFNPNLFLAGMGLFSFSIGQNTITVNIITAKILII